MKNSRPSEKFDGTVHRRSFHPRRAGSRARHIFNALAAVWPGLGLVAASVGVAHLVNSVLPAVSALVAAVAIGALLTNVGFVPSRALPGTRFAARYLLRLGIVLLGFRLAIADVLSVGSAALGVVVFVVFTTFFATRWIGRRLGVSGPLALLIATGFSICGASAVAAVEGVADAEEEEVAFAIGLVTLCGSLAIVVLPALSASLGLSEAHFGSWTGASVHDVAQVIATASTSGNIALESAVIVKLTRVVLLAPLVFGISIARRRKVNCSAMESAQGCSTATVPKSAATPPLMPLFVLGFLVAVSLRSAGVVPADWLGALRSAEGLALAAALVGLGTGVELSRLRQLGGRPVVLALVAWVLIAGVSLVGVLIVDV